MTDWSPGTYARFRGFRLRPALDLLAQVPDLPPGEVVDLGCGDGAVSGAIAARFPGRAVVGVDASLAMLEAAAGRYARTETAGIADWVPWEPPALIFSNAALQWVPGHAALIPRLAGLLAPGGTLAVQMPRQGGAPSHRLLAEVAEDLFPGRTRGEGTRTEAPEVYARLIAPLGAGEVWETEYLQRLPPGEGHPVRRFTEATAMRPYVEGLSVTQRAAFVDAYEARLAEAYPAEADGAILFAFRRLFFVLTVPEA